MTQPCSYVLPLRWFDGRGRAELTSYLCALSALCDEVIVVDGSPPGVFAANAASFAPYVHHLAPTRACRNGKVAGVLTGVEAASHEHVVLADDDVRYDRGALRAVLDALAGADLVVPQNYFSPAPWHARWDTARILLNRAAGGDFPGTLALRRSLLLAIGGYDGDVLFENLELMRTVAAHGGRVANRPGLYVRRLPPTTAQFLGQRVRQAYDEFATPARMAAWLALGPAAAVCVRPGRRRALAAAAAVSIVAAERARRRCGGSAHFPATASALAPLWLLERALCAWLALWARGRHGGIGYHGNRIRVAAHSRRGIRARAPRPPLRNAGHAPAPLAPTATASARGR